MTTPFPEPNRRQFLTWAAASAGLIATHADTSAKLGRSSSPGAKEPSPRILSLDLLTPAPLAKMKEFYHRLLGLSVLDEQPDRLTVAAGGTRLTFIEAAPEHGKPFYHFAFNIPENKILSAGSGRRSAPRSSPSPQGFGTRSIPTTW